MAKRRTAIKPWYEKFKHEEIIAKIKASDGYVISLPAIFGVESTMPIYDWLSVNPDGKEAVEEARKRRICDYSDEREKGVRTIAEMIEDNPATALKACIYHLETHAQDRGYGDTKDKDEYAKELADNIGQIIKANINDTKQKAD